MKIFLLLSSLAVLVGFSGCTARVAPEYGRYDSQPGYYGSEPGYWERGRYRHQERPVYRDHYYGYSPEYRNAPEYRSGQYWR